MTTLHIVGLDTSLAETGFAVIRAELGRPAEIRTGTIPTRPVSPSGDDYYSETLARLRNVAGRTLRAIREGRQDGDPMLVAFEGPSYGSGSSERQIGHDARAGLRWLLYHLIEKEADAVVMIPPANVKQYVTGKGSGPAAEKPAMVAGVQRMHPDLWLTNHNEADALAIASMLARQVNHPVEASVQRCHPFALNAVKWPRWIRDLH